MDKRRRLIILSLIIIISVSIVIVVPIGVTNRVVSNNRRDEFLQNRIVWDVDISFEIYNINHTTIGGCNYTDSVLAITVLFSEWDAYSHYELYFGDPYATGIYWLSVSPNYPQAQEILLNSTSLINGREIYRNFYFNNWTEEYDVSLHEVFRVTYEVVGVWHQAYFKEDTQIGIFSIANGFNWG